MVIRRSSDQLDGSSLAWCRPRNWQWCSVDPRRAERDFSTETASPGISLGQPITVDLSFESSYRRHFIMDGAADGAVGGAGDALENSDILAQISELKTPRSKGKHCFYRCTGSRATEVLCLCT